MATAGELVRDLSEYSTEALDYALKSLAREEAIKYENELQHTNFKYDADNHYIYPNEDSVDDELELDDDSLCHELDSVNLDNSL